jgi:hypothetical protein
LSPKSILPRLGYLTGPGGAGVTVSDATAQMFDPNDPDRPVKAFLQEYQALFGFGPEALDERSAVIYTLLGSCRRHVINPFDYLKDLFSRLPAANITEIKQFTPAAWVVKATAKQNCVLRQDRDATDPVARTSEVN